MKILISAYACEPGRGSEPEIGFRAVIAAARQHDIWVLTRNNSLDLLGSALAEYGVLDRVHLVGLDVPGRALSLKKKGRLSLQWYYDVWQRAAGVVASDLDRAIDFDVLHHVTFANYWSRVGIAQILKPLVWGPIGGAVATPWPLVPSLGLRGLIDDSARFLGQRLMARGMNSSSTAKLARVVLCQNREAATRLKMASYAKVVPHALAVEARETDSTAKRGMHVVLAGRLIPWKAAILAVRAMKDVSHPSATLHIYGDGPERRRLEGEVANLDLVNRVRFQGWVSRPELQEAIRTAGCLVHPALHDDSPLVVAEALTMGTPVVCLSHGGPRDLVEHWPNSPAEAVPVGRVSTTVRLMATAIDRSLASSPSVPERQLRATASFAEELLSAYERSVASPTTFEH